MAKKTNKKAPKKTAVKKKSTVNKAKSKTTVKSKTKTAKKPVKVKKAVKTKTTALKPKKKTIIEKTKKTSKRKKETKLKEPMKKTLTGTEVEVISPTKKIKVIKGYPKKDLDVFKSIILEKREEIIEQLQNLKDQMMDPTTGQYVNESSPYSLHMAEQGTDAQEREKLYLWAQRENKFLGYLEDALQRIENGTYGICIDCIDEPQNLCPTCPLVPKERLMAVPHTQHCLQVKQKMQS